MKIILGGEGYLCEAPVKTWVETGLRFKPGEGARRRTSEIDLFVWHWTGGEASPSRMFNVLQNRKLGVEFAIGREESDEYPGYATIWQFCDPIYVDTFDAGKVNRFSMGCEVVNYGYRRLKSGLIIPKAGRDRPRSQTIWNKRKRTYADFYPYQLRSVLALADAVTNSGVTGIQRAVPRVCERGDLLRRPMSLSELKRFRGHVGHNHVSPRKSDPGTQLLSHLMEHGY